MIFKGEAKAGMSCWPEYFDNEEIAAREKREGKSKFSLQYLVQSGVAGLIYPLRLENLIIWDVERDTCPTTIQWSKTFGLTGDRAANAPSTCMEDFRHVGFSDDAFYRPKYASKDVGRYATTVCWVDPSGKGKDSTGWCIASSGFGKIFIKALGGYEGVGYSEYILESICKSARQHGVNTIYSEDNFGSGMWSRLMEPILQHHFVEPGENDLYPEGWRCSLVCGRETRLFGMKERRIVDTLEPLTQSHRIVMDRQAASNRDFQHQYTRMRAERRALEHDDIIESMAEACRVLSDTARLDPEVMAEREKQQRVDDQLRQVRVLAGAGDSGGPRWFRRD